MTSGAWKSRRRESDRPGQGITIRHCSIYDMPRAGINIGDGCWGGHVIEFCDVFDTVKETGDHGSFNSWGRDRFWSLGGIDFNNDAAWEANKALVTLDACKTTIIRNNRWRCDHGWDIDLDDGSSNYHIYNNLCLQRRHQEPRRVLPRGGKQHHAQHVLQLPLHVWYKHSGDVVRRNIFGSERYGSAGGMPDNPLGQGNGLQPRPLSGLEGTDAGVEPRRPIQARRRIRFSPTRCSSIRPRATSASRMARRHSSWALSISRWTSSA